MAYTLAITFDITETDTGETISTQKDTERFDSRSDAEQAAARYKEAINRKRGSTEAGKLSEIFFLSDEWTQGEYALLKMGKRLCHREIYKDPNTGEMYINFDKARYYQSEFAAAALQRMQQGAKDAKEMLLTEAAPAADLMQPQSEDTGNPAEDAAPAKEQQQGGRHAAQ